MIGFSGNAEYRMYMHRSSGPGARKASLTSLAILRASMSVILAFHVDATEFLLGQILAGPPAMQYELERLTSSSA
mgnify:CR=1 FL=1